MADFIVLVDRPAIGDRERQLKDGNGRYVWHLLFSAKAPMHDLAIEFLYDENGHNRWRSIEAKHKPRVVVAMGQECSDQFGIDGKVQKTRGSVYKKRRPKRDMYVIPTFHPQQLKLPYRMFMEESLEKGFYTAGDIRKAVRVYKEGWPDGEERFNLEPTLDDVRQFVDEAIREQYLLGTDLEATGLNVEYVDIVVMGFAWSEEDAIVMPLTTKGGKNYWTPKEWPIFVQEINRLFDLGKFMFQNGVGYDIPLLRARGWDFKLKNYVDETMVMHHTINPELPHNIGFISSIYGRQAYWKDSFLSRKEHIFETDQLEMRTYNARDCIALHQIRNGMQQHMDELMEDPIWSNIYELYQQGMAVSRVVIEMQETGLILDKRKVNEWHKYVTERLQNATEELSKLRTLPDVFKLTSGDHLRFLLYGEVPSAWSQKYHDELKYYEHPAFNHQFECGICGRKITKKFYEFEDCPPQRIMKCPKCKQKQMCKRTEKEPTSVKAKDKTSKKYKGLMEIKTLLEVVPLYRMHGYRPPKTNKGKGDVSAVDKGALVRYLISIDTRLSQLASMKRRRPQHDVEEAGLTATRIYIVALQEYIKISTLQKSFWTFPTWQDGRVRPHFLVTGTATGRFSCKNPNLQQVPSGKIGEMIRSCFRADKGHSILSVDFSNLEVQIGARIADDKVLIAMLEAGINVHDENTKIFFGITKKDPKWKTYRDVAKIIVFARIWYGGSDNGIYSQVMTEVPDCGLTLPMFKEAVQNYFKAHPDYIDWAKESQDYAVEHKLSINAFGRVRSLLGPVASIKRQALNSPVQGSAADTVKEDMILISKAFKDNNLNSKMVLQIHDELVFDIDDTELEEAGTIVRDVMTRDRTINGHTFSIPIDAEIGTYWGALGSIDLNTFKLKKGSKH